jgi:hypothetical protein
MGQYWKVVNLDKREFIHPHKLGCGLKLWEQVNNHPGTGPALLILCAAMPVRRGGGDLSKDSEVAKRTIGRWAGNRICLVGDYCKEDDIPGFDLTKIRFSEDADEPLEEGEILFTDISDDVCAVVEEALNGKFVGAGWRNFEEND